MRRCFCFSYVAWGGTHCGLIWIFNISPVFTLLATKSTFQIYSIWNMSSEKLFWNRQFFNVCIDSNLRKEQINGIKFSFENCYSNQVFDVSNQCLSQMPFFECLIQFKSFKGTNESNHIFFRELLFESNFWHVKSNFQNMHISYKNIMCKEFEDLVQ